MTRIEKIIVVLYPGIEYKKTIEYGSQMVSIHNVPLELVGVIPDATLSCAMSESVSYETLTERFKADANSFFENVYAFCESKNIKCERSVEHGALDDVIDRIERYNNNNLLIIVPAITKGANISSNSDSWKKELMETTIFNKQSHCPVIAVL
ncbi:MAG: universal stress protein [Nitrospirae bacterium]|nr:universal stress protein [Nitrospirota bacterium]